jgi:hypothetical protein
MCKTLPNVVDTSKRLNNLPVELENLSKEERVLKPMLQLV